MLFETPLKRATTGLLTTSAGGVASATIKGANGLMIAGELVLGNAAGAVVAVVNDQGITLFSKTLVAAGQFVPGNTLTDGTTPGSTFIPLYGDLVVNITGGGNVKTLTVNFYYR